MAKQCIFCSALHFSFAIIAWINYINLATARAVTRARSWCAEGNRFTKKATDHSIPFGVAVLNGIALLLALLIVIMPYRDLTGFQDSNFLFHYLASLILVRPGQVIPGGSNSSPGYLHSYCQFKPIEVAKGKWVPQSRALC
jgi:putative ABC transport system permease protein